MSRLLITVSHLYLSFGQTKLFKDVSLHINEGNCFALIGENGSGKTTLLSILAGFVQPEEGKIQRLEPLTIGFLPQEVALPQKPLSVRSYIENGPLRDLEKQMEICLENPDRLQEWEKLHEEYENKGGYRKIPLEEVLNGLRLEPLLDLSLATLSSGKRRQAALAKALLDNPDLLLLDEPTNHLDQEMVGWLQEMVLFRNGATVIVSHDRKFLNKTCNHLIELKDRSLTYFGGTYDFYLEERETLIERQIQAYEAQVEERDRLRQKIQATTFSKPKAASPKDRNIMAYDKHGEAHQRSLKRSIDTMKERLDEIEAHPLAHPRPKTIKGLHFSSEPLASTLAIEFEECSKAFGEKVLFSGFSKRLEKGKRVVLQGPNGSGKTTLLQCALGKHLVDSGSIRYGSRVRISYLDQEVQFLPMEESPLTYFEREFHMTEKDIRSVLHKAALEGADLLNRPFGALSVGQRKRLMLLKLVLEKPNVLVLDEPTNHLDFLTLEAFEKALLEFEGAILAVSHDLTFIDKIATEIWSLR